ncbi:MAG: hypothetical protein CFK52_14275, partial [Chloracidobacterium sp. CP2_5A]
MINIPVEYAQNDVLRDAYSAGYYFAIDLARFNIPRIGDKVLRHVDWQGIGPYVTRENVRDYHMML